MQNNDKEQFCSIGLSKDTPKNKIEVLGQKCDRCGHCCSYGSGYFLDEDIKRISQKLGMEVKEFIEKFLEETESFNTKLHKAKLDRKDGKPYGPCIFFEKEKAECTIHDFKPLHCRLAKGCGGDGEQIHMWFMLNYLVNPDDPESVRQYAEYLKLNPTIPGGELKDIVKDEKKLKKILSFDLLR